jgi:nucleotide-binding universal stress UspA family protein
MRDFIVATDFTHSCDHALRFVWNIDSSNRHKPTLVHFNQIPDNLEYYSPELILEETWGKKVDARIHRQLIQQLGRVDIPKQGVHFKVVTGHIHDGLQNYFKDKEEAILVMGPNHHGQIYRHIFGSFLESTLTERTNDILIINDKADHTMKHIAVAINLGQDYDSLISKAANLAKDFNAKLSLIHVLPISFMGSQSEEIFPVELDNDVRVGEYILSAKDKAAEELDKIISLLTPYNLDITGHVSIGLNEHPEKSLEQFFGNKQKVDCFVLRPHAADFSTIAQTSLTFELMKHLDTNYYLCK